MKTNKLCLLCGVMVFLFIASFSFAGGKDRALVLQEMSWVDVRDYLRSSDMVIIPLGATEQHGPHLPLGTDYYEAFEMSKKISKKTGVVVAPVLFVGYSVYHSGFQGSLSLKPETMEQVLSQVGEKIIIDDSIRSMLPLLNLDEDQGAKSDNK